MIGSGAARGLLATIVLGATLCLRPAAAAAADPPAQVARDGAVHDAAREATAGVVALSDVLDAARDAARRGSALVISGDQDPAPELVAAAAALEGGADLATRAQADMRALAGILASVDPGTEPPALAVSAPTLLGIASQLRESAASATAFVERRHASEETLAALGSALGALEAGDLDGAEVALRTAREAQNTVAAWESPPPELSIWLETTSAMLSAADRIVVALRAGDPEDAGAAGVDYHEAASRAALADRALALAIAEGGGAVTATVLLRIAGALEDVASAQDELRARSGR